MVERSFALQDVIHLRYVVVRHELYRLLRRLSRIQMDKKNAQVRITGADHAHRVILHPGHNHLFQFGLHFGVANNDGGIG